MRTTSGLLLAVWLAAATCAPAADKKPAEGRASGGTVEIQAKVLLEKQDIQRAVGAELEDVIAVVEVRIVPVPGAKVAVLRDDFELWSSKNGGRSTPFAPSQIAGSGVLVVSPGSEGGLTTRKDGRVWRPPVGDGRPRQIGGNNTSVGNTGSAGENTAQSGTDSSGKDTLQLLEEKILPEKEATEPVAGLLYFYLEGRHKPKDVTLRYRGAAGKLVVEFKD